MLESESESVSVATTQPRHLSAGTGASLTAPTASPTPETRPATVESPLMEIRSDADLQVPELEPRPELLESGRFGLQSHEIPWNKDCALDLTPAADGKSTSDKKEAGAADGESSKLFPPGFASWSKSQKLQASYNQRPELRPLHAVIPRAPDYLPEWWQGSSIPFSQVRTRCSQLFIMPWSERARWPSVQTSHRLTNP